MFSPHPSSILISQFLKISLDLFSFGGGANHTILFTCTFKVETFHSSVE